MAHALKVHLFGNIELSAGERSLPKPPTLKSQSLLAYLLVHRRQLHPREHLADLFWGDRPEEKPITRWPRPSGTSAAVWARA